MVGRPRRAKALMVQGTMSNVGKSLLVAGLARVLAREGFSVAPFKGQNMALNSGVTADGLEMGRAQVLQAQAAGVTPDARMNPVLLKPTGQGASQVVVRGRAVGTMPAREYFSYRASLAPVVRDAYESLAAEHDVVVIEGAGSPAEINLGPDAFVNMGMAHMAHAPVLLVGDIDPGGVFAQLCGTMGLLAPGDRRMVRALVVNKFRGDASILRPGLAQLEELCGVPVAGVVPYMRLDLDDEDSLSDRLRSRGKAPCALVDVACVRLPHLANFTDLAPLERHPQAGVRYVTEAGELGRPDVVVLPGTKSTLDDLAWLREAGLDACIQALAGQGTPVIGICGGYQMLGESLADPRGVEGAAGQTACGLGLLPVRTEFATQKRLACTDARLEAASEAFSWLAGLPLRGYEVHMGETLACTDVPGTGLVRAAGGRVIGMARGCVLGTYLHGLFDAAGVADACVDALLRRRGLPGCGACVESADAWRERQLDVLADGVANALDMGLIHRIMDEGVGEE